MRGGILLTINIRKIGIAQIEVEGLHQEHPDLQEGQDLGLLHTDLEDLLIEVLGLKENVLGLPFILEVQKGLGQDHI